MFAANNNNQNEIIQTIAETFALAPEKITPDLSYQSILEWDSMGHVNLMLALEKKFGIKIDQALVLELTSVQAIINTICPTFSAPLAETSHLNEPTIHRGLTNIYYDYTEIAHIDGENGKLYYRGYPIDELVNTASFTEVAYLLLMNKLPSLEALTQLEKNLLNERCLSKTITQIIEQLSVKQAPVDVLRTACSALSAEIKHWDLHQQAIAYLAKIPLMIGMIAAKERETPLEIPEVHSHAAYLLQLILGKKPDAIDLKLFEKIMILQAEHDSNASTFAARIASSTRAQFGEALTSAIATFSGELHGGALVSVMEMLEEIAEVKNVEAYLQKRLHQGLPIYGFGHRVYRTLDPRANTLKYAADLLSKKYNQPKWLAILEEIKMHMSSYIEHGININVDYYACVAFLLLGIPKTFFVPIFIANRTCGWSAHILEQHANNILLRPRLKYQGRLNKKYKTLS